MPDFGQGTNPEKEILLAGGKLEYRVETTGNIQTGTWVNVGYLSKEAGQTFNPGLPQFQEVFVTGLTDPVKRRGKSREPLLKATLVQCNPVNLAIACGQAAADVASGKFVGGKVVDAPLMAWRLTIPNEDEPTKNLRIVFFKGRIVEAPDINFKDESEVPVPVTIRAWEVTGDEDPEIVDGTDPIEAGSRFQVEQVASM